jgi:hypothetical protein
VLFESYLLQPFVGDICFAKGIKHNQAKPFWITTSPLSFNGSVFDVQGSKELHAFFFEASRNRYSVCLDGFYSFDPLFSCKLKDFRADSLQRWRGWAVFQVQTNIKMNKIQPELVNNSCIFFIFKREMHDFSKISVPLHCVFHGNRFKVN